VVTRVSEVDVVVVGAGAMGSAAAWWLAREGRSVALLERFEARHVRGSSHGPSRIFRLVYGDPFYVGLALRALPLWRELEDDAGEPLLTTTGGVDHGPSKSVGLAVEALRSAGAAYETLSPEEASERWPAMHFGEAVLFQPDAGRCHADATVRALQRRAAELGADIHFEAGAVTVEALRTTGVVARTESGDEYRAPVGVVACGPWASAALDGLLTLPCLTVTREQIFYFTPGDSDVVWPSFIHHRTPFVYGLDTPGRGVKVAEHHTGAVTDPDSRSFEVDPEGEARVRRYVEEWFPGLDPEPAGAETCLYTTTPTEDFVVDRVGPVVVAAGFSGHGFKFVPLIGRLLADVALGRPGPSRFSLTSGVRWR
jgi:sarcosine oxidase